MTPLQTAHFVQTIMIEIGGRDRTLAVKRRKNAQKSVFFLCKRIKITTTKKLHISSIYAKILGETNFCEVGQKQKMEEKKRKRKKEKYSRD